MKRKAKIATMILMALMMLTGCGEDTDERTTEEKQTVTLWIGTPPGDEVEYTRATQDASETEINSLTVYDFLVEKGTTELRVAGVQYLIKASGTTPDPGYFVSNAGGATACLSLPVTVGSTHVFACVANEEYTHFDSIMQPGISPMDSLRYTPCTRRLKSGQSAEVMTKGGMVMSGMSGQVTIAGDGAIYRVSLQRIVARVDVTNNVSADRNFKLMGLSARNCTTTGFLFEQAENGSTTAEKNDYTKLGTLTQNPATIESLKALTAGNTCGKVLYLYEHLAKKSNGTVTPTPILALEYTLNGSPGSMEVEMKSTSGGARFDIRRNRRYTLVVGDGGSVTRVACTVKEEETN